MNIAASPKQTEYESKMTSFLRGLSVEGMEEFFPMSSSKRGQEFNDFTEKYNSVFCDYRKQELTAAVRRGLSLFHGRELSLELQSEVEKTVATVFDEWFAGWQPEIRSKGNFFYQISFGQENIEVEVSKDFDDLSRFNAVSGHPLAWPQFCQFMRSKHA